MITFTESAIAKIGSILSSDPLSTGKKLRIDLVAGGCSGWNYVFEYDDKKEADQEYVEGKVVVSASTLSKMDGSTIDYREDFGSEGFVIQNPNVKKSCGCGNSVDL